MRNAKLYITYYIFDAYIISICGPQFFKDLTYIYLYTSNHQVCEVGGIRQRNVDCVDEKNRFIPVEQCEADLPTAGEKPITQESCNDVPCGGVWQVRYTFPES